MADKEELEITISDSGDIDTHVIGTKGKKCLDMTKSLEDALGVVVSRETQSSFYEQDDKTRISVTGM